MSEYVKMRPAYLKMETAIMDAEAALAWAGSHINPETGWLLAEAPERFLWLPLGEFQGLDRPGNYTSLVIFCPEAEIRLYKGFGQTEGRARMIMEDRAAEPGIERVSTYLLAKGPGRLEYAEFFRGDAENGILKPEFARYCGVRGV